MPSRGISGLDMDIGALFLTIVVALVLAMPYIGAVSKSIWANIFFKYDKEVAENIN